MAEIYNLKDSKLSKNILEYDDVDSFPESGESSTIYIDTSADTIYRWDGSEYAVIGSNKLEHTLTIGTQVFDGSSNVSIPVYGGSISSGSLLSTQSAGDSDSESGVMSLESHTYQMSIS